jgi:hypothetical protein
MAESSFYTPYLFFALAAIRPGAMPFSSGFRYWPV